MKALLPWITKERIMSPKIVPVEEAGARLRELISLAEQGEEVMIGSEDQPKVKLVPIRPTLRKRVFGQHRGQIRMRPDFDEPLPESFWRSGTP
jgi:antitoxin (DNA-binding transcriptional repressor) of toxin-antitoxin stability system